MTSKILLTGSSGNLGKAIQSSGYFQELLCPDINELDIRKTEMIRKYFDNHDFDIIIHCAAIARMKDCQKMPENAVETNIIGTANLVRQVMDKEKKIRKDIRFVHISTDGVYNCTKGNYSERDATIPYNIYGWTKLGAESAVNTLNNFCIIRTSFFNPENIQFKESATDAYSSKMDINELVKEIAKLAESKFIGTINVGSPKMSDYERYKRYKQDLNKCLIKDIEKEQNFIMAHDASMDCKKLETMMRKNSLNT